MAEVQGSSGGLGPIRPEDKKLYEQEYKHAADLFQRALGEDVKSDNKYQKYEFQQVMQKAMMVLNETARELKKEGLAKQNQQIEEDFKMYQSHPDAETQKKLEQDLERAKRSV